MWLVINALIIFIAVVFIAQSRKPTSRNSTVTHYNPPSKKTKLDDDDDLEDVRTMYMADRFDDKFR